MNTLFQNAVILTEDYTALSGCLGVENDKIAFVGDVPEGFKAQRVIDCERNILMPALFDTHTHLPMSLFRSIADDMPLQSWLNDRIFPLEAEYVNNEMAYWFTLLSCAELIRGGAGAVNDSYYCSESIVQALIDADIRALVNRSVLSAGGGVDLRLSECVKLFEYDGANDGKIKIGVAVHAEYTNDIDTMLKCRELARTRNAPLSIHVSETHAEHEECKQRHNGKTPVQLFHELDMGKGSTYAHCVWVDEHDIELLANDGTNVSHCPRSNLKLGSGIAPVPEMLKAGVNVTLGTDSNASNNTLDVFSEMNFCALLHKGYNVDPTAVPAAAALDMSTKNAARSMNVNSGVLKAGKQADIIMLNATAPNLVPLGNIASSLVYSANSHNVVMNMNGGSIIYEDGEFYTIDYERVLYECSRIAENLK